MSIKIENESGSDQSMGVRPTIDGIAERAASACLSVALHVGEEGAGDRDGEEVEVQKKEGAGKRTAVEKKARNGHVKWKSEKTMPTDPDANLPVSIQCRI